MEGEREGDGGMERGREREGGQRRRGEGAVAPTGRPPPPARRRRPASATIFGESGKGFVKFDRGGPITNLFALSPRRWRRGSGRGGHTRARSGPSMTGPSLDERRARRGGPCAPLSILPPPIPPARFPPVVGPVFFARCPVPWGGRGDGTPSQAARIRPPAWAPAKLSPLSAGTALAERAAARKAPKKARCKNLF
jgi:hypothetical protein